MKKYEYLSELEKRLSALPADVRRDALNYYEEYFDAAGPDNEDATAAELGDPAEAARKILEGEGLTPDADPAAPESARGGAVPPAAPEPPAADPQPARPQKHGPGAKTMWLIFAVVIVAALLIQLGVLVLSFAKPGGGTASMVVAPTEEETAASGLVRTEDFYNGTAATEDADSGSPLEKMVFTTGLADAKNITFDIDYGAVTVVVDSGAAEPTLSARTCVRTGSPLPTRATTQARCVSATRCPPTTTSAKSWGPGLSLSCPCRMRIPSILKGSPSLSLWAMQNLTTAIPSPPTAST